MATVLRREADHFEKCPACSQWFDKWFDMRDLAQVAEHVNDAAKLKLWKVPARRYGKGRYIEDLGSKPKSKNARNDQPGKASQGKWRVGPRACHLVATPASSAGHPARLGSR
jgi:hypothetical protein